MRGHICAPPTHVLGNLLWGTTQTLEGVRNPYMENVTGLSVINDCGLKILLESCSYACTSKLVM